MKNARLAEILLVEDNEDDLLLTRRGFERAKLGVNAHHAANGEERLALLRKQGPYADAPTPDLILLDLNMPLMDGRSRKLTVVILTTSSSERELLAMYNLRCNAYATKPIDFQQFQRVIAELQDYWFTVAAPEPKD